MRAHRPRMAGKVDMGRVHMIAVVQQVVERCPPGRLLQPVDATIAPVVGEDHGKRHRHHHRRRQFAIGHHIAAIADHADHIRVWPRQLDAHRTRNLIAHAGEAIFHMVASTGRPPDGVQSARHRACRTHHHRGFAGIALHSTDDLHITRQIVALGLRRQPIGRLVPCVPCAKIRVGKADVAQGRAELFQRHFGIRHQTQRTPFGRVIAMHVDRQQFSARRTEHRPRPGGEIGKPGADANHQIRLCRQRIAAGRASHTGRTEVQTVLPIDRTLARLGLHHRDIVLGRKTRKHCLGPRIDHATTGHDQRLFGGLDRGDSSR